jgi:peptidoglycan hydrolase-like protein with peptidoglycan-binding domain
MRIQRSTFPSLPATQAPANATRATTRTNARAIDAFEAAPPASSGASFPTLREGDSGDSVAQLQQLLAQNGFDPGSVDGEFGPQTAAALSAFQESVGLDADEICGPLSWSALEGSVFEEAPEEAPADEVGPIASTDDQGDLRQAILDVAQGEVGTMEETGNNDGDVLKYPGMFGRGSEPYCADFVSWVFTNAGKPMDFSYVPTLRESLEENGQWKGKSNPQPGDIVIFDFEGEGEGDHVGIVKAVNDDGTIETIEGNTSPDDRLSDSATLESGVWNRVRSLDDVLGFGTP